MASIKLNVYDDDNNIIKTVEATELSIRFGTVRSLMKLLKIDDVEDTASLITVVMEAWGELIKILDKCFPEMEESDWDGVELEELVPAILELLKGSFRKIQTIPQSSKK